jgi:hypothetical protein
MTASTLDIRGHTVRRDGEVVATLTYSGGYINVHQDGQVIGRAFRIHKDPDEYYAWNAKHPASYTPSDEQLTDGVPCEAAIAVIIWRHEQEQRRLTTVEFRDSEYTDGDSTLVTSNGHGTTNSEWRLSDLRALLAATQARIDQLEGVRSDAS